MQLSPDISYWVLLDTTKQSRPLGKIVNLHSLAAIFVEYLVRNRVRPTMNVLASVPLDRKVSYSCGTHA
jgi:hypothetical protein